MLPLRAKSGTGLQQALADTDTLADFDAGAGGELADNDRHDLTRDLADAFRAVRNLARIVKSHFDAFNPDAEWELVEPASVPEVDEARCAVLDAIRRWRRRQPEHDPSPRRTPVPDDTLDLLRQPGAHVDAKKDKLGVWLGNGELDHPTSGLPSTPRISNVCS